MKKVGVIFFVSVAIVSFVFSLISRTTWQINFLNGGIKPSTFLIFANMNFLLALLLKK